MPKKINTAEINLKDAKFIDKCKSRSGYDYKEVCAELGKQILVGLGVDGSIGSFLLADGKEAKVKISLVHGRGIFELVD